CCKVSRILAGLAPATSRNSPALIGSPLPKILARSRKLSEEAIRPSSWSLVATDVSDAPEGTTKAVSSSTWDDPHHPQAKTPAEATRSRPRMAATRNPLRLIPVPSVGLLDHQAGIGAPEAEAVVEHRAHRPLLGLVRHQVHALATVGRIVEVQRRRHDPVAQREDAEDRFD